MTKQKILTVTIHDCTVQYFKASGSGGQKRNKTSSACRVIHEPSGARAECSESRSQHENKREAFIKMVNTPAFKFWLHQVTNGLDTEAKMKADIEKDLADPTITITEIHVRKDEWKVVDPKELK